jgi:iron complex outermembrane recepter protein
MKRHVFLKATTVLPLIAAAGFSISPATAQVKEATASSIDDVNDNGVIIVTAQRRAQSITDVPISMAVVGADTLASRGVKDLASVASFVSNTQVFDGGFQPQ